MRVAALALVHHRPDAVAGDGAGDEDDIAVVAKPGNALPAEGQRVDRQLELVASLRAWCLQRRGAHLCPAMGSTGPTSSSSRAFCAWRRFSA